MEAQITHLTEIQKLDMQIGEVLTQKKVYPEKIQELNKKLKEDREAIAALKNSFDENIKERKRLQEHIKIENERIERVDGKLPNIKTNKEYQALVKETDTMKKDISKSEDTILKLLDEEKSIKSELETKEEVFESEEKEILSQISSYEGEMVHFDDKITTLESEKMVHTKDVDGSYLKVYERVRHKREGIAIVAVIDGVCQGCFRNLPPQLFIMVQKKKEIHTCPNCNRMLYWKEEG